MTHYAAPSSPKGKGLHISLDVSRDWPLLASAATALLSFLMLFVPWISGYVSPNAFGTGMQAAGPALIIVMVTAVLALEFMALAVDRKYAPVALIPASCLLVVYIMKLGDVGDLINFNQQVTGISVGSIGVGLWLGFFFALATLIFLILSLVLAARTRPGQASRQSPPPPPGYPPRPPTE
ncbi:hypothetical protein [Streptomyces sp. NBC_01236]|uniref:hypothetical protein n=1 Tax=Streptomyces sp. NBC_01236 TaxID=2903789 RepID=UPI002E14FE14|nr:hypothetical protein OG324_38670 [Streptomyces sp. NBC_01236]